MNCNEAASLLSAYADGETDRARSHSIERHLRACAQCAETHRDLLALRTRLHEEIPYFLAPQALRARIEARLEQPTSSRPADRAVMGSRWRWLTAGALAGCAATALAWTIGTALLQWRANEDLALEAVQMHVRATLNHHLIDIASSDQHTVKPWLSARLDYSPPVRDFADDGFALVGGRLDYFDRQPVGVLVYRYREHTIDVFVRPDSARAPPSAMRTVRGFNVAHAMGSGMDWLAVSDVNADVLSAFVRKLAQR
jgi:anti-sigma factor RsiW